MQKQVLLQPLFAKYEIIDKAQCVHRKKTAWLCTIQRGPFIFLERESTVEGYKRNEICTNVNYLHMLNAVQEIDIAGHNVSRPLGSPAFTETAFWKLMKQGLHGEAVKFYQTILIVQYSGYEEYSDWGDLLSPIPWSYYRWKTAAKL